MAKKEAKETNKKNAKISAPSLFTANKIKKLRNKRAISTNDIALNTDINYGALNRLESSDIPDKYSFGKINSTGKYLNRKVFIHNNEVSVTGKGYPIEAENIDIHDLLPPEPLLSKTKIDKVLIEVEQPDGPQNAIQHLFDAGFFKKENLNAEMIAAECEHIFKKEFVVNSVRNRLNELVALGVLKKHKVGKTVYYQEV